MTTTTNPTHPEWTRMFSCSITRTTSHGYSNTCDLATAVRNTQWSNLWNLGKCFAGLGFAIALVAEQAAARKIQTTMDHDTTIAQLGGRRIFAMAFDARMTMTTPDSLILRVARALQKGAKAHMVTVTLAADDTYTVTATRGRRGGHVDAVGERTGVYCDSLRAVVEELTGLYLAL